MKQLTITWINGFLKCLVISLSRLPLIKVKEFVKGGEFEKIHRNETRTRDRDELSR